MTAARELAPLGARIRRTRRRVRRRLRRATPWFVFAAIGGYLLLLMVK
jgi:type VI protein secretion system component VasF